MPVVKADAYRHGAVEVSRTLEEQGANWLAVSSTEEGVSLRDAGIKARILVMADFLPFTREAMLAHGLTPVIHSLEDLKELDRIAAARAQKCRYHLKIDSGMGRLGVQADAAGIREAILAAKNIELEGLMTHFASAANYQTSQTDEQALVFDRLADELHSAGVHPALVHLVEHDSGGLRTANRLAKYGTAGTRDLRLRFTGSGARAGENPARETRADVARNDTFGEGRTSGLFDWIWRHVSRHASDAGGGARGRLCGWSSAPTVESGQRYCEWPTGSNCGGGLYGPDVH